MAYIQDVQESVPALPEAGNLTSFVVLSQNENGRKLLFKIVGIDIPSGSTATFSGTKPDGVVYSTTGTISGNIVTVNEDVQMTAVAGSWDAKIRVLNGGNVIASAKVRITIDADPVAPGSIPSDSQLDGIVAECQAYAESARSDAYGSPLTASTAAGMIDKTRVYVYTGSETGYTNGHWYYWDGTAWTDGGTYNSSGIQTDTTLSVPGMAADAKAVGDELTDVKEDFDDITIIIPSTNLLNPSEIVQGKFIRLNGTEGNGDVYAHTGYIPVSAGDNIILADGDTANEFRFVTAYDSDKNVLASSGQEYGYSYVVPEGVAFVIISVTPQSKITSPTAKINNSSNPLPYEPYGDTVMPKGYDVLSDNISTLYDMGTPSTYNNDKVPYLFRPSGGGKYIGGIEKDTIVGGTVAWNQLCNGASVTVPSGHKYYMVKGGTASIGASTGTAITGLTSGTDTVSDLTQMFGSTIADYIYSLEQATAGSGIAKLKSWGFFTEDYYPYGAGSLKSVEGLSAHITRDADENIIGNYPLDSDLILRGIPKLDSSNQLYYDGDIYKADGSVIRKYGTRAYQSGDESLTDAITDGTNTVYKLATPTTETADPYQNPQIVDKSGTEEYVTTGIVPVGHDTEYYLDADSVLTPPSAAGTYSLKVTVASDGSKSYSWVSD